MTVQSQLRGYIALQRLLDRRTALKREHDTSPEALTTLRSRFAERHEKLAAHTERHLALEREQRGLEHDLESLRPEREHFKKQRSQVTNMKQYSAVVSELDHVETQIKAKEERLAAVLAELETVGNELAGLAEESPEERAVREQAESDWATRRLAIGRELGLIKHEMAALKQSLGATPWARFERLWNSRKPTVIVPLEVASDGRDWSCSSCHANLRPSLVQQVKSLEEMAACDTCRRLLYDPDQFPAE